MFADTLHTVNSGPYLASNLDKLSGVAWMS